jgi:hypothetical protein
VQLHPHLERDPNKSGQDLTVASATSWKGLKSSSSVVVPDGMESVNGQPRDEINRGQDGRTMILENRETRG